MNGPEHYRQAEALVSAVMSERPDAEVAANMLAAAQVHATLALAFAHRPTITGDARAPLDSPKYDSVPER